MDIKARIEEVINQKGLTMKVVAERMGKFNQAFNSLLTNPKWETIELVANAIGISTCEMLYGIKSPKSTTDPPVPPKKDELPFSNEQESSQKSELMPEIAIICPHCHEAIKLGVIK